MEIVKKYKKYILVGIICLGLLLLFIPRSSLALSSSTMFTNSFMDSTQGGMGPALIRDIYYTFGVITVTILMF